LTSGDEVNDPDAESAQGACFFAVDGGNANFFS
jgi:hypothetical protein